MLSLSLALKVNEFLIWRIAANVKCFRRNLPKKITKINCVSRLRLKHSWTKPGHTYGYLSALL